VYCGSDLSPFKMILTDCPSSNTELIVECGVKNLGLMSGHMMQQLSYEYWKEGKSARKKQRKQAGRKEGRKKEKQKERKK
jgi:hypothetical protein